MLFRWRRSASRPTRAHPPIEAVESRRLLAPLLVGGTLGDDEIYLNVSGGIIHLVINASPLAFDDSAFDSIWIDASSENDQIRIGDTGMNPVTVLGGFGDDSLFAAAGLDGIRAPLHFDGGFSGNDELRVQDGNTTGARNYSVADRAVLGGTAPLTYIDAEVVWIEATTGNNHFDVNLSTSEATVALAGGEGRMTVDAVITLPDAEASALVAKAGDSTQDHISFSDAANPYSDPFEITADYILRPVFVGLVHEDFESISITLGSGRNAVTVTGTHTIDTFIDTGGGEDTLTIANDGGRPVVVATGPGNDDLTVENPAGAASAVLVGSDELGRIVIGAGDTLTLNPAADYAVRCRGLTIDPAGRLDIAGQTLAVDYTGASPIGTISTRLASGYSGGAWNGAGIVSSVAAAGNATAVGLAEASDLFTDFPANFAGLSIDSTTLLLRHTLYGDANLDRRVDLSDFARLAPNFNRPGRRWVQGDFNFDAVVNLSDFAMLAARFNQALPGQPARSDRPLWQVLD